jgi:predicted 3-demethylubiquinone-9 3-methyltransferase (glyoxalase superfamily)
MSITSEADVQKIIPHLWFDKEVREATDFCCSVLPESRVTSLVTLHDTPSGDCDVVNFNLAGQPFMGINGGPLFKFNPSVSFIVNFDPGKDPNARGNLDRVWEKFSDGGNALMPLQEYPFSKRYGWIQDKYGLSWQLILTNPDGDARPVITPSIMFTGSVAGRAEEAIDYYCSTFKDGRRGTAARYPKNMEPEREGTLMYADFRILDTWMAAMDSARDHKFAFNEAISFMVPCDTQDDIDYFWKKLSAIPEAEQCGWCKDKYGLSWQVVPTAMNEMMKNGKPEQIARVTQAFLPMKKFDIAMLEAAYNNP